MSLCWNVGSPVKLQRKRELEKHILNASEKSETEKTLWNTLWKCELWVTTLQNRSEKSTPIGVPCKTAAKTPSWKNESCYQRHARNGKTRWNTWWKCESGVPTLQNISEKSNSIGAPCKTTAKTRVGRTNFEWQRNARNKKTLWNTWWKCELWVSTLQNHTRRTLL